MGRGGDETCHDRSRFGLPVERKNAASFAALWSSLETGADVIPWHSRIRISAVLGEPAIELGALSVGKRNGVWGLDSNAIPDFLHKLETLGHTKTVEIEGNVAHARNFRCVARHCKPQTESVNAANIERARIIRAAVWLSRVLLRPAHGINQFHPLQIRAHQVEQGGGAEDH